jgi:hypothetical protein
MVRMAGIAMVLRIAVGRRGTGGGMSDHEPASLVPETCALDPLSVPQLPNGIKTGQNAASPWYGITD